jgi:transketolase
MTSIDDLTKIATRLRILSMQMTSAAGSGHPTSCLSCADIVAALFFHEMQFDPKNQNNLCNDEFVLSKGHAAPILYAAFAEAGIIPHAELKNLRKLSSILEGHPMPSVPFVKVSTGSLGQGLAAGLGIAFGQKMLNVDARTFVLLGDGECAEGSVWEAANCAGFYKMKNLVAVVDVNRLGQSDETMFGHMLHVYVDKFVSCGWEVHSIEGHDFKKILRALDFARRSTKPVAIIARTVKGKGVSLVEDKSGWHGKALSEEELSKALQEIGPMPECDTKRFIKIPERTLTAKKENTSPKISSDGLNREVSTREACGNALVKLGACMKNLVVIDGDVKNSTMTLNFFKEFSSRSIESYIAEQNMIGIAMGLSAKGFLPVVATFSAFLTRAHDNLRMAVYSKSNIMCIGTHSGVSIGEDGASQMGLEDVAMFRSLAESVVVAPCDAVSAEKCVESVAMVKGVRYVRALRPKTQAIYESSEKFPLGKCKILRNSSKDIVTVIAAGITVHEALKAYDTLKKKGVQIKVIDAYSIRPLDVETLSGEVAKTKGKCIVVEDHYEAGGLGEAVFASVPIQSRVHLCIRKIPHSGKADELLDLYGISARHIIANAQKLK